MQKDIQDFLTTHLDLLVGQARAYAPFIKNAFPNSNMSEACFNLIIGNAFSVFLSQHAMRIQVPTEQDLAEFGTFVSRYRGRVDQIFAE